MHYLKTAGVLFAYNITMSLVAYGITMIQLVELRMVLLILNIIIYCSAVFALQMKEGMDSVKVLYLNNRSREKIIETGEDIKIRRSEEYKTFKGFLFGALAYSPYLLLMIAHAIITAINPTNFIAGEIGATIYMMFYAPIGLAFEGALTAGVYYIALYGLVLVSVLSGVAYILGARKIFKQHERIESYNKSIYGE